MLQFVLIKLMIMLAVAVILLATKSTTGAFSTIDYFISPIYSQHSVYSDTCIVMTGLKYRG